MFLSRFANEVMSTIFKIPSASRNISYYWISNLHTTLETSMYWYCRYISNWHDRITQTSSSARFDKSRIEAIVLFYRFDFNVPFIFASRLNVRSTIAKAGTLMASVRSLVRSRPDYTTDKFTMSDIYREKLCALNRLAL